MISLTGKYLKFQMYDKSAQMARTLEKFKEPVPPSILRFELRMSSAKLPLHFNAEHNLRKSTTGTGWCGSPPTIWAKCF
jgi:hypothetical protein